MAHAAVRASIAFVLAALGSCGGASREFARPAAQSSRVTARASQRAPAAEAASPLRTAVLAIAAVAEQARAPREVLPYDAWSEHQVGERAAESGYEQRFPLHGIAFHLMAQVFSEASEHGEVVGYLRRGTRVRASEGRVAKGCDKMWHELDTGGFVCAGRGFMFGKAPQSFEPSPLPAALTDALPYPYAKNTARSTLQYWRIPTPEEESAAIKLLATAPDALLRAAETSTDPKIAAELQLPDYARMPMEPGFYVSVDQTEQDEAGERSFVRTVRGAYVPSAALSDVVTPAAPGVLLGGAVQLPLGITPRAGAKLLARDALGGPLQPGLAVPRFTALPLSGERTEQGGRAYLQMSAGTFVAEQQLRVATQAARPPLVPKGARWIHVNLAQQTLVAYEGARAVFATLVSSGREGYETPAGLFRIFAKHVSTTMDGLAGSDEAYSIEDVPWTMYFQGNYALHAAFWHDHYGNVRSHGCVNLAPADARWLFRWSTPGLPSGWHGVIANRENLGTWVWIE